MAAPTSVEAHYRDHLGPVYDWMLGDFDEAAVRAGAVEAGLEVTSMSTDRGLVTLVARRP